MPRSNPLVGRRAVLAALGTGALAGLAGCSLWGASGITAQELDTPGGASGDWGTQTKLTRADDGVTHFGSSVALAAEGRTALVSATYHEDGDGLQPGPAYLLERTDDGWRVRTRLAPDDGDSDMSFGWKGGSTALSGDATTALVGADRADEPNGPQSGAAFGFWQTGDGWERAKLVPADGAKQAFFGRSTALSGDGRRALVGAWGQGDGGAAYVFERTDGGWRPEATLAPDDGGVDWFGVSVALSEDGTTAVIGAVEDDEPGNEGAGSAFVFRRADGSWGRTAKLVAIDGDSGDSFGWSVALDGATAIVGAGDDEDPNGDKAGSAYVFERASDGWRQQAKLAPNDGDSTDLFGVAVALSGETALVGARVDENPNGEEGGSAYVFRRRDGGWHQRAKLAAGDGETSHLFGRSVALAGDTACAGTSSGAAYVW